jgi:hypothetical protein
MKLWSCTVNPSIIEYVDAGDHIAGTGQAGRVQIDELSMAILDVNYLKTPKAIQLLIKRGLREAGRDPNQAPTKKQIRVVVARLRKQRCTSKPAELHQIAIELRSQNPLRPADVYAVGPSIASNNYCSGTDSDPVVIGFTSRGLRSVLHYAVSSGFPICLHVDATHGCNRGYKKRQWKVLTVGITDANYALHPLIVFLVSHESTEAYERVFRTYMEEATQVVPSVKACPAYIMSDGALSIKNAVVRAFPTRPPVHLMCWFHVVKAVKDKVGKCSVWPKIWLNLKDLHMARSEEEFLTRWATVEDLWNMDPDMPSWAPKKRGRKPRAAIAPPSSGPLFVASSQVSEPITARESTNVADVPPVLPRLVEPNGFIEYFKREWIELRPNWQAFRRPARISITNNPLEALHRMFKQSYSFSAADSIQECARKIIELCKEFSELGQHDPNHPEARHFAIVFSPNEKLKRKWARQSGKWTVAPLGEGFAITEMADRVVHCTRQQCDCDDKWRIGDCIHCWIVRERFSDA